MDHHTWKVEYRKRQAIADRITEMRRNRLVAMTAAAGLDPSLLGIHPHNAMCAYNDNRPWPNVDYEIVKKINYLLTSGWRWEASRIVKRWDDRVR